MSGKYVVHIYYRFRVCSVNMLICFLFSFPYIFLQGDTLENVAKELDCIISTGNYLFQTPDTSSRGAELILEYSPSQQFTPTSLSQPSNLEDPELGMNTQRWNSEQIGDFVRKLGFLDTEKEGGDKIKNFLHINEVCVRLVI